MSGKQKNSQEPVYLMEAANGLQVWVPESRLEAWQEEQQKQRGGAERPPERQALIDRLVQSVYGSKG